MGEKVGFPLSIPEYSSNINTSIKFLMVPTITFLWDIRHASRDNFHSFGELFVGLLSNNIVSLTCTFLFFCRVALF